MTDPRVETVAEKERIEAMVTAILGKDWEGQAVAAEGLDPEVERMLRAGASIVAGLFGALGPMTGMAPKDAWRTHLSATLASRQRRP